MATFTRSERKNELKRNGEKTVSSPVINIGPKANSLISDTEKRNNLGNAAILERSEVPDSHRRTADSYMIIKKIFGTPVVQAHVSQEERDYLARYDLNPLEYTTARQMIDELSFLKKSNYSGSRELIEASEKIINIRAKELKKLVATNFVSISNPIYTGYKVLEKYFQDISKYME